MVNLVTCFADASLRDGHAGYAFWCRREEEFIRRHERVPWKVPHIGEAETIALSTAITTSLREMQVEPGVIVVAQSDSLECLGVLMRFGGRQAKGSDRTILERNGNPTQQSFARDALQSIADLQGVLWLKHVKGHSTREGARHHLNRWCDAHAKLARLEAEQHASYR